jgi:hypothetical protein
MRSAAWHRFCVFPSIAAVLAVSLTFAHQADAQSLASDPNVDNGTHWYGSYDGVHENISLSSGNLSFCIPLANLKGRNGHTLEPV